MNALLKKRSNPNYCQSEGNNICAYEAEFDTEAFIDSVDNYILDTTPFTSISLDLGIGTISAGYTNAAHFDTTDTSLTVSPPSPFIKFDLNLPTSADSVEVGRGDYGEEYMESQEEWDTQHCNGSSCED